jgi:hypothetical protein
MKNTSKRNLNFQFNTIIENLQDGIQSVHQCDDMSIMEIDGYIENLEVLKEIKVALATLTN